MKDVLVLLIAIEWIADDIHYTTKGPEFYQLHLLADKIKDITDVVDDINEVYYLGMKECNPPSDREIATLAIVRYDELHSETSMESMFNALFMLEHLIEQVKVSESLTCGCQSILDEISLKASKYKFLVGASNARKA